MRACAAFLLLLLAQIVAGALAVLTTHWPLIQAGQPVAGLMPDAVHYGIALLGCESLLALGLWLWTRRDVPLKCWTSRPFRPAPEFAAALAVTLGLHVFFSWLAETYGWDDGGAGVLFEQMRGSAPCWLLLCVVGPLCEELVMRSCVLRTFVERGLPVWLSVGLSALLFGLLHGNWMQGIAAFVIGIPLGLMYLRTGNLRLCLPVHILNNTAALLFL